jgi:hypothetical protein
MASPTLESLFIDSDSNSDTQYILSIPPMSAEPERIFSGARRTITWQCMRLGPVNIERLECLKSWVRGGIVLGWRREQLVRNKGGVRASRKPSTLTNNYNTMPRLVM